MKHLFSVVIPCLNEGKTIGETLKSVRDQTYPNVEIIVSDGCSTDNTVKIAKKYADRVLVKKTNIAQARNLGARHAKGDILVFVDADSQISRRFVETMAPIFDKEDVIGVYGKIFPKEGGLKSMLICKIGWQLILRIFNRLDLPQFCGINIALRRDVFNRVGGFNEEMNAAEDIDLGFRLKGRGKIKFNKKGLVRTSMRRYEKGYLWWVLRWVREWVYYFFRRKTSFKEYKPIR